MRRKQTHTLLREGNSNKGQVKPGGVNKKKVGKE